MVATQQTLRLWFVAAAGLVLAVCTGIARSVLFQHNPTLGAFSVTFDLTVTIPILYYLFMVRCGRASVFSLLPVVFICLAIARIVIPTSNQQFLRPIALLAEPLELASIGYLMVRVRRLREQNRLDSSTSTDPFERFQQGARTLYGDNRMLDIVIAELAFAYYGLFGWFRKRAGAAVPEGTTASTCYERSGWSAIVGVLVFLIALEGSIVHLLLLRWSVRAAWTFSCLDAYTILWLLGDYQALRLRPLLLTADHLHVRLGLRWSGLVPLNRIASVDRVSLHSPVPVGADILKVAIMADPEFLITLREPLEFNGLLGRTKTVRRIAILADDSELMQRLQQRLTDD